MFICQIYCYLKDVLEASEDNGNVQNVSAELKQPHIDGVEYKFIDQ